MNHDATFPRPAFTGDAAPFWLACREHRIAIQACADCGELRHPPRPACASCGSDAITWRTMTGRGEVWSCTVIHPPTLPAFAERTPYAAVVVRLDEGPFLVTSVVGVAPQEVAVGMPVEVSFTDIDGELTLPHFRPSRA